MEFALANACLFVSSYQLGVIELSKMNILSDHATNYTVSYFILNSTSSLEMLTNASRITVTKGSGSSN